MASQFLSQEEIDALIRRAEEPEPLEELEKDALGEIGNMAMGAAATALSEILGVRVSITTPHVSVTTLEEFFSSFTVPYVVVEVNFTEGVEGLNVLVVKVSDAAIIADLMMGKEAQAESETLDEMQLSAVGEAMNQMIGSAATSMSLIFKVLVKVSPPRVEIVRTPGGFPPLALAGSQRAAVVSFCMKVGELVNSEIMQVVPVEVAQKEARLLLGAVSSPAAAPEEAPSLEKEEVSPLPGKEEQAPPEAPVVSAAPPETPSFEPVAGEKLKAVPFPQGVTPEAYPLGSRNLDLLLDVPLNVTVILGRAKKPIKEVLELLPGGIVELEKLVDEPVEVLVNGILVAEGEVVVVNENFGVKIINILSPSERIHYLRP